MQPERIGPLSYQVPYALCLLVCDSVSTDRDTGKPTIIGCFTSVSANQFPTVHPGLTIFAELTDGRGEVPITLRLCDVDEEWTLYETAATIPMDDPLVIGRVVHKISMVQFPKPGEYRVQLFAGDDLLLERRVMLIQIEGDHERLEPDE